MHPNNQAAGQQDGGWWHKRKILRSPLTILLVAFFLNTALWSALLIPSRGPDEGSFFDTIQYIAETRNLPVYGKTHYLHNPARFNPHAGAPPLYFLLAAPIQRALAGDLLWQRMGVRLLSVLLGTMTVWLAYAFVQRLAPERPDLALATGVFVGFNPMFTYISAAINTDNLINLIYAALLLLLAEGLLRRPLERRWLIGLGLTLGLGVISKLTIAPGILISAALVLWLIWRAGGQRLVALGRATLLAGGAALLVSGWYIAYTWLTYGTLSIMDVAGTLPEVYVMNPYKPTGSVWQMIFRGKDSPAPGLAYYYNSFWGMFDYMDVHMPTLFYALLNSVLALGLIGAALRLARMWRKRGDPAIASGLLVAFWSALLIVATVGMAIYVNYETEYQPQGRYLFVVVVPLSLAVVAGWDWLGRRLGMGRRAAPLLAMVMLAVNVVALISTHAPAQHEALITYRAQADPGVTVNADTPARIHFIAQDALLRRIDLLLKTDAPASPLHWQLTTADGQVLHQAMLPLQPGLTRYQVDVANQPLVAGQPYVLSLANPAGQASIPLMRVLPDGTLDANEPGLNPVIIYPPGANLATLERVAHAMVSDVAGARRTTLQYIMYALALPALVALGATLLRGSGAWGWLAGGLIITLVMLMALLAAPRIAGPPAGPSA